MLTFAECLLPSDDPRDSTSNYPGISRLICTYVDRFHCMTEDAAALVEIVTGIVRC